MLDISQFNERIIETCVNQCKPAIALLVIGIVLLLIDIIYFKVTRNNDGLSLINITKIFTNRFTTKEQIALKIVGILALLVLIAWTTLPVYQDLSNQQFECVSGQYTYETDNQKGLFSNGRVRVDTGENIFYLELPANWSEDEFPTGTRQGTIYYSKASKIFVSFIPQ